MLAAERRAHLDLPFTGLAIGDHQIGGEAIDLIKEPLTYGLAGLVVLRLEAVGTGDAAALGVEHGHLDPGNGAQQFEGVDDAPHLLHVAGGVVGDVQIERLHRRFVAPVELVPQEAGHQGDAIPHLAVVLFQQVGVFVPQGEAAGGGGGQERHLVAQQAVLHLLDVEGRLLLGLVHEAVGNERHAAALLPLQQLDTNVHGVEHLHQLLAKLRVVVVDVAAVEVGDLARKAGLRLFLLLVPAAEGALGIFGQVAVGGDPQRLVQRQLHRLEPRGEVDHGGHQGGHAAHQIGVGEHELADPRFEAAVLVLGLGDDVADAHPAWAGHFTALAVGAVLEGAVKELRALDAQPLPIRARLLGARVGGVGLGHRAVGGTDGAFDALIEGLIGVIQ
ncbi:hypothetical protein D3C72_1194820 [compost metagenome]